MPASAPPDTPPQRRWWTGITVKLFYSFVAVGLVVALAMAVANRFSFDTGFLDYLGEQEQARFVLMAEGLAEDYTQKNDWGFAKNSKTWRRIVARYFRQEPAPKNKDDQLATAEYARRTWHTAHVRSSLGLMSADKSTLLAGVFPSSYAVWHPITTGGATIGWLTREPLTGITDNIDLRFQKQQTVTTWIIASLSLLVAAFVSVFMARLLLAPVHRLAEATNSLTQGNYSARATVGTKDELGTLATQFNTLALTLQKNENARRTFMAEISHDLRTPLAILRGEIEALEEGVRPVTPASLQSLKAEVAILTRLVDDIHALSLADLGSLAYEKKPFDVVGCLRQAAEIFQERFTGKGLRTEVHLPAEPLVLFGDQGRLVQVFHNVFENSIRYTDAGGCLHIHCFRQGDAVIIRIEDSAPGVPESMLPHIFERFHTGDSARNRQISGSGLGLAICRSIITAHGGGITPFTSPLGGLGLEITLPLHKEQAAVPACAAALGQGVAPGRPCPAEQPEPGTPALSSPQQPDSSTL